MRYAQEFFETVHGLMDRIWATQQAPISAAAEAMARSVAVGGVVHLFGGGHSQMLGMEVWYRAGQPACISPIFDQGLWPFHGPLKGSALEKLPGYGDLVFQHHDTRPGEVIVVVSNSGRNSAPLEVALAAKERGLTVVGLTSMDHTTQVSSKHVSGKRLFEVADITIDNGAPMGDAVLSIPGVRAKVGPVTTILSALILDAILVEMDASLAAMGIEPPVFLSANMDADLDQNEEYIRRYRPRVGHYAG